MSRLAQEGKGEVFTNNDFSLFLADVVQRFYGGEQHI